MVYNLQQGLGIRSQTFDLKIPGADGAEWELDLTQIQRVLQTIPLPKSINHTNNSQTETQELHMGDPHDWQTGSQLPQSDHGGGCMLSLAMEEDACCLWSCSLFCCLFCNILWYFFPHEKSCTLWNLFRVTLIFLWVDFIFVVCCIYKLIFLHIPTPLFFIP